MKPAIDWLNIVGETVMLSAFAGGKPPGVEVEQLIECIQSDARAELCQEIGRLKAEINASSEDERRMDYLAGCERVNNQRIEQHCKEEGLNRPCRDYLVLACDGTTCWGKTYREAVDKAMAHDGWKGTE